MGIRLDLLHGVTDEELRELLERNPGYPFERTADGRLIVTPPGLESGRRGGEVFGQLREWNRRTGLGVEFDSSTGFRLPDGSLFSPEASWEALRPEEREGFGPLCPEVVFEVRSVWRGVGELREKMGVLIDPYGRVERYEGVEAVSLDPELPGFVLELGSIFA